MILVRVWSVATGSCGGSSDENHTWLAERRARIETQTATRVSGRAVVELLAHLEQDGQEVAWPVAVVAESTEERSVVFRTYCSQVPVDGRRHLRPQILEPGADAPGDVVGRYHAALEVGDVEAIVSTFAANGYFSEPIGDPRRSPWRSRAALVLRQLVQHGGRHRRAALCGDRRRGALRRGVQLHPLGRPGPGTSSGNRCLRAGPGRPPRCGPRVRRHRATRRLTPFQSGGLRAVCADGLRP